MIPYGKHFIDEDDIQSVVNVLRQGNLTQGPKVEEFENAIKKYVGSKYAVAVSSCTAGLHLTLKAANIGKGDYLATSPITFVSSANAALYVNSKVEFIDIDSNSINMSPNLLEKALKKNKDIKAITPVHFAGYACDMDAIKKITKSNYFIVEDAAHALGGTYPDGTKIGNCKYSDATVFSFHPVKSISAGEGGMITTNNKRLYKKLLSLRSHGINKLNDSFINKTTHGVNNKSNPWYYEMQELGYHYRITDIQCALGLSQLKKLDKFILRRKELVQRYDEAFKDNEFVKPIQLNGRMNSAHHLYVIKIFFNKLGISRGELMKRLKDKNIITQVHYIPVTDHPFYNNLGFKTSQFKCSEDYYKKALSIPLYYSLTDKEQDKVVNELIKNLR